jgi:hypothetical protein
VELFSQENEEKILVAKIARKLAAVKKGRNFSRKGLGKSTQINQYYKEKKLTKQHIAKIYTAFFNGIERYALCLLKRKKW